MAVHPKLNWEEFQHLRKIKKQRAIAVYFLVALSTLFGLLWCTQPKKVTDQPVPQELTHPQDLKPLNSSPDLQNPKQLEPQRPIQDPSIRTVAQSSKTQGRKSGVHSQNLLPKKNQTFDLITLATKLSGLQITGTNLHISPAPLPQNARHTTDLSRAGAKPTLSISWIPAHSPLLKQTPTTKYRSLNSFNISIIKQITTAQNLEISTGLNGSLYRFQMQHQSSWRGTIYQPNTVTGYTQSLGGFFPIVTDSVRGTFTRQKFTSGSLQQLQLPLHLSYPLLHTPKHTFSATASTGIAFQYALNGEWYNNQDFTPLNQLPNYHWNVPYSAGINWQIHLGHTQYHLRLTAHGLARSSATFTTHWLTLATGITLPL